MTASQLDTLFALDPTVAQRTQDLWDAIVPMVPVRAQDAAVTLLLHTVVLLLAKRVNKEITP